MYQEEQMHHQHPSIDSNGKLQHPNRIGSVDVSSTLLGPTQKTSKNKVRSEECAHLARTTSFALTALCIWRLTCPAGCALMGTRGSHRTWLTARWRHVSGFKALEHGRPKTFAENGRRKLGNWKSVAQTTGGLHRYKK